MYSSVKNNAPAAKNTLAPGQYINLKNKPHKLKNKVIKMTNFRVLLTGLGVIIGMF